MSRPCSGDAQGKASSQRVVRMPGVHCALYAVGHCLYEEWLNPGASSDWRCPELSRYLAAFDTLLEQAERFSLSSEAVAGLWESRSAEMPPPGSLCTNHAPRTGGCPHCAGCSPDSEACGPEESADRILALRGNMSGGMDCRFALDASCVLRMPPCEGVCSRFRSRTSKLPESTEPTRQR